MATDVKLENNYSKIFGVNNILLINGLNVFFPLLQFVISTGWPAQSLLLDYLASICVRLTQDFRLEDPKHLKYFVTSQKNQRKNHCFKML